MRSAVDHRGPVGGDVGHGVPGNVTCGRLLCHRAWRATRNLDVTVSFPLSDVVGATRQ
jgi:hypothetical protein